MNNIQPSNSSFLDQLTVFQSANSDYESIKNNFVIRKEEFSTIIDSILNKKANDPLQHELILGRRGSGKSTLLKRIEVEIVENAELNQKYIPINLAEEQAGIYRLFDLWEEVLQELKICTKTEINMQEYSSFENNEDYTRYLYSLINEVCAGSKKKIILLLDNFDRIVENFDDDGNLLRETLINYNNIQVIAGSTRMDEHFWRYDKPFYEFFRKHRLEALSREEMDLLLHHWSDILNMPVLKDFVKNNPGKIENIRILTDGLPRTLQFFIQIVLQKSETTTYEYLKKTMDNVSPLFQERLNALPAQLRKIILEMAFVWEACSTKQLVEKARMESKLISANLKTLVDKGLVDKIETNKKQHLYRLSERFFNMWLIVTQGNPEQKRKAKWLSIFLENWYDANDLTQLASLHIERLQKGEIDWEHALVFSKALSQNKFISLDERDTIIELTENLKCDNLEHCLIELPEKYSEIRKRIRKLIEDKNFTKAIEITEAIENEADGVKFMLLGLLYSFLNDETNAEKYMLLATDKGSGGAYFNIALFYQNQKKYLKAEKYYLSAIEKGDTEALINLASIYYNQEKYLEAEKCYLQAIEKGDLIALNNLALLYDDQGKYLEAEKYYLLAIDKGIDAALFNLALLYKNQEKYPEAEKYYLLAIDKGIDAALFNLALLYHNQTKFFEAENYYRLAIDKGIDDALFNLALLYDNQAKYLEAEKYYLQAIEKGDDNSLNNLALLCKNQERYPEAEKYYLLAIEKGIDAAFNNLANLYSNQGKYPEAEKYYLLAIEKGNTDALNNLANLYSNQGKYSESEKYYLLAIESGDIDTAYYNLALLYQNQEKYTESEKYYLLAIEKGLINALNNLAYQYYKMNRNKATAFEYIKQANEKENNPTFKETQLTIELWNGIFIDVENRIISVAKAKHGENLEEFIIDLLVQQQKTLVLRLFQNEELGKMLQDKYMVLYYVTLLLNNPQDENLKLRIPPELQSTIDDVLKKIADQQELYASNKSLF